MSQTFRKDLTGLRFGRLTVLEFVPTEDRKTHWKCQCVCGSICDILGDSLHSGKTASCGCLQKEIAQKNKIKHNLIKTKLYSVWKSMHQRCLNHNDKEFKNYGGRGISVHTEWKNDFKKFYDWAMQNEYKEGLSIDRIDVNGNYEPNNCRWVDMKTQCRNKRNNIVVEYQGRKMCLQEAAEKSEINIGTLWSRYSVGDRGERLFRPVKKQNNI